MSVQFSKWSLRNLWNIYFMKFVKNLNRVLNYVFYLRSIYFWKMNVYEKVIVFAFFVVLPMTKKILIILHYIILEMCKVTWKNVMKVLPFSFFSCYIQNSHHIKKVLNSFSYNRTILLLQNSFFQVKRENINRKSVTRICS